MGWAGKTIVGTVLTVSAFVIGVNVGDDREDQPIPAPVVKEVPKYVEREKVVEKKVVPKSCLEVIQSAVDVKKATDKYEDAVGRLPDLIDDTYQAIQSQDMRQLNQLKQQQIKLEADSIQALLDIRSAQERLDKLQPRCNAATR